MQNKAAKISLILFYAVLFFVARWHFYKSPLAGEEGMFAELFVNRPEAPDFLIHGRIDGRNLYHWPAHPAGMYYMVEGAGVLFSPLTNAVLWRDDAQITPVLRFLFSLIQFVLFGWVLLFLIYRKERLSLLSVLIPVAVMISPTAIITSVNLQLDGSVGILMSGVFAMSLLYVSSSKLEKRMSWILLFVGSFFLALGKQEWSMIALAALVCAGLYMAIFRSRDSVNIKADTMMLAVVLAGLAAGNLFSYLLESRCYIGGLKIFWSFSEADKLLEGRFDLQKWLYVTEARLRWICIPLALIGVSSLLAISKIKRLKVIEIFLLFYGFILFAAYFVTSWAPEARYFAPSMVVLTITVVALLPSKVNPKLLTSVTVITVLMVAADGLFLYNNVVKKPRKPYFDASRINLGPDQVAILTTAEAWNKPDIDFVNYNAGKEVVETLARKFNKSLYPEDFVWWNDKQTEKDKNQPE